MYISLMEQPAPLEVEIFTILIYINIIRFPLN